MQVSWENALSNINSNLKLVQEHSSFLEFTFEGEVGTGLGPTLEVYSILA